MTPDHAAARTADLLATLNDVLALLAAHGACWSSLYASSGGALVVHCDSPGELPAWLDQMSIRSLRVSDGLAARMHAQARGALITWPDPAPTAAHPGDHP